MSRATPMKVGVVGAGRVGAACALALVTRGSAREVLIVDRTRARARAIVTDLRYGAPLCPEVSLRDGDYSDLHGAGIVVIAAGVNEKSGGATDRNDAAGRLKLLDTNAGMYRDIVPKIVAAAPEAVLLVATDPPDPLADLARRLAKHDRVLSTGTLLDSLRFRVHVAERLGVSAASIEALVVGPGEWCPDCRCLATRDFARRAPQASRARCSLREHRDHRRQ